MRQESSDPITVAIDSPGGSLAVLETLLGMLQGPMQVGEAASIITVVTNRAFSAAANLLAFGDYAVAFRHSTILCHDVRYGEIADVTPAKAMIAAKSLQDENDKFAAKLANKIIRRLIWVYLGLIPEFEEINKKFSKTHTRFKTSWNPLVIEPPARSIDIASFATALYAKLSVENDSLVDGAMLRLTKWINLTKMSNSMPTYREKGSRKPGMLDGAINLYKAIGKKSDISDDFSEKLKLMLTLIVSESAVSGSSFERVLDEANRDFLLIQSMNDTTHRYMAMRLILRHESIFFQGDISGLDEKLRKDAVSAAMPSAQLFWLFCVSLCRELFEGEHILSPEEGQLLGLVDEVAGGGAIESRREFRAAQKRKDEEA